jgi:hypothetical protein
MYAPVSIVSWFDADIFEPDAWDVINGIQFEDDKFSGIPPNGGPRTFQ